MSSVLMDFTEEELNAFDTPVSLRDFLYEAHKEHTLTDISELIEYFLLVEKPDYVMMLKQFEKNEINTR